MSAERKRSDYLLNVILPTAAVRELKATGEVKPRHYDDVAVLFCDIVGFISYCDQHPPEDVVQHLQHLGAYFETIAHNHGLEKIKTVGDVFMATSGLLRALDIPLLAGVRCGLDIAETARKALPNWEVRIGLHKGPVVAGIVGHRQYLFDLWGDTVNIAARMAELGDGGTVTMTHATWLEVQHDCEGRLVGEVNLKGKGAVEVVECFAVR